MLWTTIKYLTCQATVHRVIIAAPGIAPLTVASTDGSVPCLMVLRQRSTMVNQFLRLHIHIIYQQMYSLKTYVTRWERGSHTQQQLTGLQVSYFISVILRLNFQKMQGISNLRPKLSVHNKKHFFIAPHIQNATFSKGGRDHPFIEFNFYFCFIVVHLWRCISIFIKIQS